MTAMYRHFIAACSVGKCPRALTARRSRALIGPEMPHADTSAKAAAAREAGRPYGVGKLLRIHLVFAVRPGSASMITSLIL